MKIILFILIYFSALPIINAQEFDNYLWVIHNDELYPLSDSTSSIPEVNLIFDKYNVNYFRKAEFMLPQDFIPDSLYEIFCNCNENELREDLRLHNPELFYYLIDFMPGLLVAVVNDSSALPQTDSTSFNDTLNIILGNHHVESYRIASSSSLQVDFGFTDCTWFELLKEINETVPWLITAYPIGMQYPDNIKKKSLNKEGIIRIIPNPADDIFRIELPHNKDNLTLKIFNNQGKLVLKQRYVSEKPVDCGDLLSGSYIIEIFGSEFKSTCKLIIK